MKTLNLVVAIALISLSMTGSAHAQAMQQCAVEDEACIGKNYAAACVVGSPTEAGCSSFIEWLEPRAEAGDAVSTNYLGHAYLALARLPATDAVDKATYRSKGIETYRGLVKRRPDYAGGLRSLAAYTDDENEKIDLMSRAIALDPSGQATRQILAGILARRGGRENVLRAAELMEGEYALHNYKYWYAAGQAAALYETAGAVERADRLRNDVRSRAEIDRTLGDLGRPGNLSATNTTGSLNNICNSYLMTVVGAESCFAGVQLAGRAIVAATVDRSEAQLAADGMIHALVQLSEAGAELDRSTPSWRGNVSALIDAMRSRGIESNRLEVVSARFTDDAGKKLRALERAVQLAPDDTASLVALAQEYMDQGRHDEAEKTLRSARMMRGVAPQRTENSRKMIDQYLEINDKLRQIAR